jgi:hypothetical protein
LISAIASHEDSLVNNSSNNFNSSSNWMVKMQEVKYRKLLYVFDFRENRKIGGVITYVKQQSLVLHYKVGNILLPNALIQIAVQSFCVHHFGNYFKSTLMPAFFSHPN